MDAPAVAVSADGKTMVVGWMDMRRRNQERDVFWRLYRRGRPGPDMELGTEICGEQGHVALAIDKKGVIHAAWTSARRILYRTSKKPKVVTISSSSDREANQPSIATAGGVTVVAYEARRSGERVAVVRVVQ